jgi:glucose-6-phosphate 1-dehydrogenase
MMGRMAPSPACAFVIFGATGDLTARKLVPALYRLHVQGDLHESSYVVGFGRGEMDDKALRKLLESALREEVAEVKARAWQSLAKRVRYVQGDYDDPESYRKLAEVLGELGLENRVFYTATPPATYAGIVRGLAAASLNRSEGFTRLVVEKPFGSDLESARDLNALILERFREEQVYRIDHYLAKETAQNLSALRFANTIFEPIWSNRYIDHVQITMMETLGVEGRGSFYEEAGVIRDVFQNHLLQLAALVAMEPPARWDAGSVRDEKVKVFRAMRCLDPEDAVLGQYVASGRVKGYRQEPDVAPDSRQATYAAASFSIQNWRWAGVPFYLRSGKRLAHKASEIVLRFKLPPHLPFELAAPLPPDRLVLRLTPNEGISFRFNAKKPGQGVDLERVTMNFYYDEAFERPTPDAYETLLLDVMLGDATLFMRADEVEAQWRIVEPLLKHWEASDQEPAFYKALSHGPQEADALLGRAGHRWYRLENGKD